MGYILLIALSLAMDAFAVSVSAGLAAADFKFRDAVKLGLWFGAFQFIMPLIGWALGHSVADYVSSLSPYISFALLAIIGGRMVWGSFHKEEDAPPPKLTAGNLFLLAVATSIDALAVGVTFAFMEINLWLAASVIGIVAFLLSIGGGMLGGRLSGRFRENAELLGGLVLIGIGIKILVEHFIS